MHMNKRCGRQFWLLHRVEGRKNNNWGFKEHPVRYLEPRKIISLLQYNFPPLIFTESYFKLKLLLLSDIMNFTKNIILGGNSFAIFFMVTTRSFACFISKTQGHCYTSCTTKCLLPISSLAKLPALWYYKHKIFFSLNCNIYFWLVWKSMP